MVPITYRAGPPTVRDLYEEYADLTHNSQAAATLVLAHVMQESKPDESLLTVKEAAKRLGVSAKSVRKLCVDGRIKFRRIGRAIRIHPDELHTDRIPHDDLLKILKRPRPLPV